MRGLNSLHPVTLLLCVLPAALIGMFVSQPVLLALSLLGALCISALTAKGFWKGLGFSVLVFIAAVLANALLTHNGKTALFFLNGSPITLEALAYGAAMGGMLVAALCWFGALSALLTSDKLLYLFGRMAPRLSVVLSGALRYIPLFRAQAGKIRLARQSMGLFDQSGAISRVRGELRVFSMTVTWSLENAIDTADSMKARGFGLPGRSVYSIFRFGRRDIALLATSALLTAATLYGIARGALAFAYYPSLGAPRLTPAAVYAYAAYGLLALLPSIFEAKEKLRWIYCKSKI